MLFFMFCLVFPLEMDHYFFIRGLPFLGLADNFFLKSNAFQTIFSLHFVMKTTFYDCFKKVTGFFIDLI